MRERLCDCVCMRTCLHERECGRVCVRGGARMCVVQEVESHPADECDD